MTHSQTAQVKEGVSWSSALVPQTGGLGPELPGNPPQLSTCYLNGQSSVCPMICPLASWKRGGSGFVGQVRWAVGDSGEGRRAPPEVQVTCQWGACKTHISHKYLVTVERCESQACRMGTQSPLEGQCDDRRGFWEDV